MTEKEKELSALREEIKAMRERAHEMQKEIDKEKERKEMATRQEVVGKCYELLSQYQSAVLYGDDANRKPMNFRVIKLSHSGKDAVCQTVRRTYGKQDSVGVEVLGLWGPAEYRLMLQPDNKRIIDLYREIPREEFDDVFDKALIEVMAADEQTDDLLIGR